MRKFLIIAGFLFFGSSLYGASKLDIGADYRFRGVQINNPSFTSETPIGSGKTIEEKYYSQRAKVYLKGKLDPGIEIGAVLQSLGVVGSTAPLRNRYPKEDFSPFIENAYLQANEFNDLPISFTIGRQAYAWGTGLLLSDDDLGFDGIRLELGPFWGFRTHFFGAKAKERITEGDSDLYLSGISYQWGIHKFQFGYLMEEDKSGASYSNITATTPVTADNISRQFFDIQLKGDLEKGAFYRAEYVMQKGTVKIPTKELTLSGSALTFEGGFDFIHPRYKRMILAFVFMQGSGDSSSTDAEDEKFNPSFGHKFDGLERSGHGEFFAANPYSFFNEDKVVVPIKVGEKIVNTRSYSSLFSGIRMFGFRGAIHPYKSFMAGLEYYIFTAMQKSEIGVGAPSITEKSLGRELVIKSSYTYDEKSTLGIRWGKFFPSSILNDVGSSRLMFEATGRF